MVKVGKWCVELEPELLTDCWVAKRVNIVQKKFFRIGSCGLYYKTIMIVIDDAS